uniref:N-acylethanolamine-hydrolyzing acid amidase (inferred by orthology to a human protein) n=1 Tax=Strongyloides venezuelensis TaxID=75913 RepID=A0A0K0FXB0_STRVS
MKSRMIFFYINFFLLIFSKEINGVGEEFTPKCEVGNIQYLPENLEHVPWFNINLDLPPRERYKMVAGSLGKEMRAVIATLKEFFGILGPLPMEILENVMQDAYENHFPLTYREEIEGISEASGVPIADMALMNIFYELSRFCTSIVADNTNNEIFHARNLDFGQLFIWNISSQSYQLTDTLKKASINLNFIKGGRLLFKGTTFAGHVGFISSMKPGAFSLTMNSRLVPDISNVATWLMGGESDVHFAMWIEREVMENCNTYEEAIEKLSSVPQLTGVYFTVGGSKPGIGSVLIKNDSWVDGTIQLDESKSDGWYILQTNYDPDKKPLYLDDRRTPGHNCMKKLGKSSVSIKGLFEVLSSRPNLNKTTVHSTFMSVTTGEYVSYIRYCPNPCWAF